MNSRILIPLLIVPLAVFALGCGGGGGNGGGGGGGGGGCTVDTSDIGDGSGTIVQGVVRDQNLAAVPNAQVEFYTAGGTLLKRAKTSCTGNYAVQLSGVPARLSVQSSSIGGYYKMFSYLGDWFTLQSTCRAPLSGINVGGTTTLPPVYLQSQVGPPPPPPTGCL